jgi:Ca2+-binding RTX toxin-like protein
MIGGARLAAFVAGATMALAGAAMPAHAATTNIGAVAEIANGDLPDPITAGDDINTWTVQVGESAGTYAVPAGYGVITAWRHSTGTIGGEVTFKVYRPTGTPNQFLVVGADPQTVVANTVHTFPVRIPVRPGDRIGISTTTIQVAYGTMNAADRMGVFDFETPDPAVGTTANLDGAPFQGFRVDVSARIETDADRDEFGDDTQDGCRTNATTAGPCPPRYYLPPPVVPRLPAFAGCPVTAVNVLNGSPRADSIIGTARGDRIFTGTGDDRVDAREGDDCADLGPGADRGAGGSGADLLVGGLGRDVVSAGTGGDRVFGGPDGDNLLGEGGNDSLFGDAGNDRLSGGSGNDRMHGVGGNDRVSGSSGRDRLNGGAGKDVIGGGSSSDRIAGDQGNDRVAGNSGNDSMAGNSGADRLNGGSGRDRLSGGTGNDRLDARDGRRDRISCGKGRDRVLADRFDRIARDCERRG